MKRVFLTVEGIVQGVGFRPYVYNLAASFNLKGWVNNNSEGVYIDIEGDNSDIDKFIDKLKKDPPPLAKIENIKIKEMEICNYSSFVIKKSEIKEEKITLISPDMAICKECSHDIHDPNNRRFGYPFTNCTNCGPRFTIIKSIPYDRDKTTMKKFQMCSDCLHEYTDPSNRRFHAQPNACSKCGPHIWITDNQGTMIDIKENNIIEWTQKMLALGKIFAIKGLGGFHLACDAKNSSAVELLRERKKRPFKPFAVMAKDMDTVKKYCTVNSIEEKLLTGIRKPIVLLERNSIYSLPQSVAPNQNTLGVMLPYTPLHELILSGNTDILIMTSANIYGLPLEYENDSALEKLSTLVDYFLMHNRDIYIPIDDSVVKVAENEERMIRRARGYVPNPLKLKGVNSILACGSNMKNTFAITKENFIFLSQHNGDLENLETIERYKKNIEHFKNIFSFSPEYIACDMHPQYFSTKYGEVYDLPKIYIQHHHAHIVSCMFENNIKNDVIGVSYDGTGYGTDGKIWGGEILICNYNDFSREAHLSYVKMPGGEKAVKEPLRMGVSYIYEAYKNEPQDKMLSIIKKLYTESAFNILKIIKSNINCPETSSMGRFFDAVSSICGIRNAVTYEGQASIELENSIVSGISDSYRYDIKESSLPYEINPSETIKEIIADRFNNKPAGIISAKFHNTVINFTSDLCIKIRNKTSINSVALSGGVFQNSYLLKSTIERLKKEGFEVYAHKDIPANDGGVSLGQIVIANAKINASNKAH